MNWANNKVFYSKKYKNLYFQIKNFIDMNGMLVYRLTIKRKSKKKYKQVHYSYHLSLQSAMFFGNRRLLKEKECI